MIHVLVWYSKEGSDLGLPWWLLEINETDSPPRRCAIVEWAGGTARTLYRAAGFTELPDGPRGIIELRVDELRTVRAPDDAVA